MEGFSERDFWLGVAIGRIVSGRILNDERSGVMAIDEYFSNIPAYTIGVYFRNVASSSAHSSTSNTIFS